MVETTTPSCLVSPFWVPFHMDNRPYPKGGLALKREDRHDHVFEVSFYGGLPPDYLQQQRTHVHPFAGYTSHVAGHSHRLYGRTAPAHYGPSHVHYYRGKTTYDDSHTHTFEGNTGPPIPLPDGTHYHIMRGVTRTAQNHALTTTMGSPGSTT
jgi:hypothetical protein